MPTIPHLLPLAWCALGFFLLSWGEVPLACVAYATAISLGWCGLVATSDGMRASSESRRPPGRVRRRPMPYRASAVPTRRIRGTPAPWATGRYWPLDGSSLRAPAAAFRDGHAGIAGLLLRHAAPIRAASMLRWGVVAGRGAHRVSLPPGQTGPSIWPGPVKAPDGSAAWRACRLDGVPPGPPETLKA